MRVKFNTEINNDFILYINTFGRGENGEESGDLNVTHELTFLSLNPFSISF